MPQLHVYVPDSVAKEAKRLARERGISVSSYLAGLLARELGEGWPEGYFDEVVGSWKGPTLERPPQGEVEDRNILEPVGPELE